MKYIEGLIILWVWAIWLALLAQRAKADEVNAPNSNFHLLSLDKFSMDYFQIVNHRDAAYPINDPGNSTYGETWTKGTAANFNLDLIKYKSVGLYWNNRVEGDATDKQFREVQWQYSAGFQVDGYFRLYWEHRSAHILDHTPTGPFQLDNFVGAEFILYKRDR